MNYVRVYNEIIHSRISNSPDGYFERHHIIPRALGGLDEITNIVKLTAREHFIAHCLLARIYGGTMWVAILRMKGGRSLSERYINSKLYESARISWSKWLSKNQIGEKNHFFGKTLTEEHKRKLSISGSLRKLTEEHKINISKANKGRKFSDESIEKMSKAKKGKYVGDKNPMFGKKRPDLVLRNKQRSLDKKKLINESKEVVS